jgi:hypothetical protein
LDSRKSIADAMTSGRVTSSSVGRFQHWVDDILKVIDRSERLVDADRAFLDEQFKEAPPGRPQTP